MRAVPARAWLGYLTAGFSAAAAYYLVPASGGGLVLRVTMYALISLSPAIAIMIALRSTVGARPRLPWLLLALSQVIYAAADVTFYSMHYLLHSDQFPGPADVFYLAHYPPVVVGLILLIRRRAPGRDIPGLLDASMATTMGALLSWLFVIGPQARADQVFLVKVTTLAYPVMDLAMLVVSLRLVFGRGRRSTSFFLLVGYLFAILAADTLYVLQQLHGSYHPGNYLDLIWLAGNLCLGAAALHPTSNRIDQPAALVEEGLGLVRLHALMAIGLAGPVLLVVEIPGRGPGDGIATAVAWAALFLLAVNRMYWLVCEQRRIAITDELTGLATRRCFDARLAAELARPIRDTCGIAVLMIDVDHFKRINDRFGHPAGDRVLREIANRLAAATGPGDLLARYGGEEFALLVQAVPAGQLLTWCERIRSSVAGAPIAVTGAVEVSMTVSVGAASHPSHGKTPDALLATADQALYRAKARGRDRSVIGRDRSVIGRDRSAIGAEVGAIGDDPSIGGPAGPLGWSIPGPVEPPIGPADRAGPIGQPGRGIDPPGVPAAGTASGLNPAPLADFLRRAADQVDRQLSGHEHGRAVGRWARLLAVELGYDEDAAQRAELAGRLHDVGKVLIPRKILVKPRPLTEAEWWVLRQHPEHGARLVGLVPEFEVVAEVVRQHHERFDGTGYPARLAGERILAEARILAVCDSWAAMRSVRPYQGSRPLDVAIEELLNGRGTQYDPEMVDAFLSLHRLGRLGELQWLTSPSDPTGESSHQLPTETARR